MRTMEKKLPIGIENFEEMRTKGFYYVDKSGLIRELLENWGKVTLFTRPRRFGKSLNMSMLKSFFELDSRKEIFDGLAISEEISLCEKYMGQFPVVSISLKGINAGSYKTAYDLAVRVINEETSRRQYLLESDRLTELDKEHFSELMRREMSEATLFGSLRELSHLLEKHHNKKVILLIDEYDVPLAKALENNYYDAMVLLVRNMFEQALKTNDSLEFAVLTGCMRISKESIFTGLNNLKVMTVSDVRFDEHFGFTDREVRELLEYYHLSEHYETIKEWYDGYQFGNVEVYCPWDVINYCDALRADSSAQPQNYWSNTSGNDAVKRFIRRADVGTTKREIEKLVAGEIIKKEIRQELTYKDMYSSVENLWSILFTAGYLTQRGRADRKELSLAIPNRVIREVFTEQIMEYFKENISKDGETVNAFCDALQNGDAPGVENLFAEYLRKTISIRDTFVKKSMKENFYHGIMLGLLGYRDSWGVFSNKESGDGYSDILIEIPEKEMGIVMELKYAENGDLETACANAMEQMEKNRYEETLREEGINHILKYAVSCYKKRCRVMLCDEAL